MNQQNFSSVTLGITKHEFLEIGETLTFDSPEKRVEEVTYSYSIHAVGAANYRSEQ